MFRRTVTLIAVVLSSNLLFAVEAVAQTALNRAVVQTVRNRVQVLRQNQSPRSAQVSDVLTPGNGLSTARSSFAELRFNDGSLGRLGEQVVFWFSAGTRSFRLSNGTVLMLIPPGQGRTQIRTPNAAAGIQGSALFVRYIPETDTTIVGALTDSGIEVFNRNGTQQQTLRGGQMVVAVGDRIESIYDFDLNSFYETSELVRGLAPTGESGSGESSDPAIAQVQAEMQTAIAQQQPLPADQIIETPSFVRRLAGSPDPSPADLTPPNDDAQDAAEGGFFDRPEIPAEDRLDQVITDPRIDDRRSPTDRPIDGYPDDGEPPIDPPDDGEPPIDPPDDGEPPIDPPDDGEPPIDPPDDGEPPIDPPDDDDDDDDDDGDDGGDGDGGDDGGDGDDGDDGGSETPTDGPGNSDGVPGGGNTNGPGNSDGVPGGGNNNTPPDRNDRSRIDRDRPRNSNGRSRF